MNQFKAYSVLSKVIIFLKQQQYLRKEKPGSQEQKSDLRVLCQQFQIVVHIDWVGFTEFKQFLQGFVDKNDANKRSKSFFGKPSDIADKGTRISGHKDDTQGCSPKSNTGS